MRKVILSGIFLFLIIFPSYAFADGPYLNIPPTNAFDKIHSDNGTINAVNFSMPLNIIGGTGVTVTSNNSTHTVKITNTAAINTHTGTYNQTLANNVVKNSGGQGLNFINGTNNPINLVNDPTRNQINITISSTGGGGGGVTSLNALAGALTIACVSGNTTCTTSGGNTITVNTAWNIVTTGLSAQTITKGLTLNALTLGGNAAGGNKNFTGLNNVNATKFFQGSNQVVDTITPGAGISAVKSGGTYTITNTGVLSAITSVNSQTGPSINIVCQTGNTTCTNSTNQVKINTGSDIPHLSQQNKFTLNNNFTAGLTVTGGQKAFLDSSKSDYLTDPGSNIQIKINGNDTLDTSINQVQVLSNAKSAAPSLLIRNLGSIAAGSTVGQLLFYAPNSAGSAIQYGNMITAAQTTTAGSEDSTYRMFVYQKGSQNELFRIDGSANATKILTGAFVVSTGSNLTKTSGSNLLYVPTSNGAVTGTPPAFTGGTALYYNGNNNSLCFYNSAFKCFRLPGDGAVNATTGQLSGNGTGTSSLSKKMDGVYATITPQTTGRITVSVSGDAADGTLSDGCNIEIRESTSNMGANGAALAGTILGNSIRTNSQVAAAPNVFQRTFDFTGTSGTKYFFDLGFSAVTGGTCTITSVNWDLVEH